VSRLASITRAPAETAYRVQRASANVGGSRHLEPDGSGHRILSIGFARILLMHLL
jgi:hypothetical protein